MAKVVIVKEYPTNASGEPTYRIKKINWKR
jgi:hypothetical protein